MRKNFLLPSTESPFVFALLTAIYTGIYTALVFSLLSHLIEAFEIYHLINKRFADSTPVVRAVATLLLKPLINALLFAALLESLRRSRLSPELRSIAAVCVLTGYFALLSIPASILLIPVFAAYVAAYHHWRETSFGVAFLVTLMIQMFQNVLPTVHSIIYSAGG